MRIGLISDTHDLLREEARHALAGVDRILHAGDICTPDVLARLSEIAPVDAVRGNNDRGAWAQALPETRIVTLQGIRILMVHDLAALGVDPDAEGVAAVVSGHSHKPQAVRRGEVLYVNPGSAGPRRFRLPISLGFLTLAGSRIDAELQELRIG